MKTNNLLILTGGTIAAVYFISTAGKKKAVTTSPTPKPLPKTPPADVPIIVDDDQKNFINMYYTTGLYKLQEVDAHGGTPPAKIVTKGNISDPEWLTNIAFWAMYTAPGNKYGTTAPIDIQNLDHTDVWYKIWDNMLGYSKTLFEKP